MTATDVLRGRLGDRLLRPDDPGFGPAARLWNAAVPHRPALIARCRDAEDVRTAVLTARDLSLPLSVRGGGHDWAGRALRHGGLVVDLSEMDDVRVDRPARTATVGGGTTAARLLAAAAPDDLVAPTGVVRAVGMAGLTLAGGYGPLNGRYGLALDGLLGAELVLADGSRVSTAGDDELRWALRGGGTNFGVVTSLTYRLHHLPTVLAGMIMFSLDEAERVLSGYQAFVDTAPDEISVMAGFLPGPAVFVCPFYAGPDLSEGRRLIDGLARLGDPIVNQVGPMPYNDALGMFDGSMVDGNHYLLRTRWLPRLTGDAVALLTAAARDISSPHSAIALHHFHGAATRPASTDTAFALRTDHLLLEIIAVWPPPGPAAPHHAWANRTSDQLAPLSLPGGYPNLLGPDETDRVRLAYGDNLDRLLRAKHRYDPDGIFSGVPTLPR
jgi:FAD/FMN-containing dehydrogenase